MLRMLLALSLLAGACAAPVVDASGEEVATPVRGVVAPNIDPDTLGLGYCGVGADAVDLTRMMLLENGWVDTAGQRGRPLRVRLQGEAVFFETRNEDRETWGFNIGHIAGRGEYLDVELKLAMVEDQLAVYWRETFQHRIYRQGLLRIVGEGLIRWCEGQGGVYGSPSIVERTTLE